MPRFPAFLALAVLGFVRAAAADGPVGPRLGVASNFGQGWQPAMLEGASLLPARLFRDAVYWADVETAGRIAFDGPRQTFPDLVAAQGAGLILIVNNGHPDHDGGHTPATPEAVAAFARHAAETVRRFPGIVAVEVGNEMNSDTFVSGPGWDTDLDGRAASYARLLAATAEAVRAVRPDVRILGGAAHSIPLAWFRALFAAGAARHMDALVIHPYTVAPEHLARQIALLRRELPQARGLPLAITEFGTADVAAAPAHLLKSYCQMALSGVSDAVWYAVNPRGDGLASLLDDTARPTAAGRAYALAARRFEGRPVAAVAPDPFTYGCRFGDDTLLIWGEPRAIGTPGLRVVDPEGQEVPTEGLALSMDRPLVLLSQSGAPDAFAAVTLGPQPLIADSHHQFAFPGDPAAGPFGWFVRSGDSEAAMELRPGQEKGGVPWTPYLGTSMDGVARAAEDWVLPSRPPDGPVEIVLRYTAPAAQRLDAEVRLAPSPRSADGVRVRITLDGRNLDAAVVAEDSVLRFEGLALSAGARLDVAVGPGPTGSGDVTALRLRLWRAGAGR